MLMVLHNFRNWLNRGSVCLFIENHRHHLQGPGTLVADLSSSSSGEASLAVCFSNSPQIQSREQQLILPLWQGQKRAHGQAWSSLHTIKPISPCNLGLELFWLSFSPPLSFNMRAARAQVIKRDWTTKRLLSLISPFSPQGELFPKI